MALDVHLSVIFACDQNAGVAQLAAKHLPSIERNVDGKAEAFWFLEALSKRAGENPGRKGGLTTWGIVGNYTDGEIFVDCLRPFWMELLLGVEGGPLPFEHILVFCEREQTGQTTAFEISLSETPQIFARTLIITEHECPFSFGQM
jgi:hypothetical protein